MLSLVFQFVSYFILPYPIHHTTNVFLESGKYRVNGVFLSCPLPLPIQKLLQIHPYLLCVAL